MLNSTKTWQEEKIKHTAEHIGIISEGALKTLVSEIRKRDMEALIKMLPDYRMVFPEQDTGDIIKYKLGFNDGIQKIKQLIKDYYEN